jgi:hypothetical protein
MRLTTIQIRTRALSLRAQSMLTFFRTAWISSFAIRANSPSPITFAAVLLFASEPATPARPRISREISISSSGILGAVTCWLLWDPRACT